MEHKKNIVAVIRQRMGCARAVNLPEGCAGKLSPAICSIHHQFRQMPIRLQLECYSPQRRLCIDPPPLESIADGMLLQQSQPNQGA